MFRTGTEFRFSTHSRICNQLSLSSVFLLAVFRQLCSFLDNISDKLGKISRVLRGNNRLSCFRLQCFSGYSSNVSTSPSYSLIFRKSFRLLYLGYISCRSLGEHRKHQFQIAHVIAEIFFLQAFQPLILPRCHSRPRTGDLIRKNRKLLAFLYPALFPFIRQFIADADRQNTLVHPFFGIALF